MRMEMPIKRRSARLSSGGRRRSARLAGAAVRAPGQLKQQKEPGSSLVPAVMSKKIFKQRSSEDQLKQQRELGSSLVPSVTKSGGSGKHQRVSGGNEVHHWTDAEEEAFVEAALKLAPNYQGWNSAFFKAIAVEVNGKYRFHKTDYVHLDMKKVKNKYDKCRMKLEEYRKKGRYRCVAIAEVKPKFGSAYQVNSSAYLMDSSSVAVVSPGKDDDEDIQAAMRDLTSFLIKRDYGGLKVYAVLLNNLVHLDVFWAHGCFGQNMEQKIRYLNEACGFRPLDVQLSPVQQQPRTVFMQSKRDALKFMIANREDSKSFSNHHLFVSSCLLDDKVHRDVFGNLGTYIDKKDYLLWHINAVMEKLLGVSSSCQLSEAYSDYTYEQ